jgi:phospholipase/lecithinase/hemolysin
MFWDGVHPTTATHQLLGTLLFAAIPEPGSLVLVAFALMALAWGRRRARA